MNNYNKSFDNEVYPAIIKKLASKQRYFTKTNQEPNFVKVDGDKVYVRTKKSSPDFIEIQKVMFLKTWNILLSEYKVTQKKLSKEYNIKRSAFIVLAFDLLDYVKYDSMDNSIRLIK